MTSLTTYLKKRANNFCPLLYLISRNLAHDFYIICLIFILFSYTKVGLFFWLSNKETACNVEDTRNEGSVSELGRFPAVGHDNQLQYSCWEKPMYREAWQVTVHGCIKTRTRLKWLSTAHTQKLDLISSIQIFSEGDCFHGKTWN